MIYWDTSALLKLYVAEPDSQYFLDLVASATTRLVTSDLARVEILAALSRREHAGELPDESADGIYARFVADTNTSIVTVPAGGDVLEEAREVVRKAHGCVPPVLIRTIDAIHVASALLSGSPTMVVTDARLRSVAVLVGLAVEPGEPNR